MDSKTIGFRLVPDTGKAIEFDTYEDMQEMVKANPETFAGVTCELYEITETLKERFQIEVQTIFKVIVNEDIPLETVQAEEVIRLPELDPIPELPVVMGNTFHTEAPLKDLEQPKPKPTAHGPKSPAPYVMPENLADLSNTEQAEHALRALYMRKGTNNLPREDVQAALVDAGFGPGQWGPLMAALQRQKKFQKNGGQWVFLAMENA